MPRSSLSCLRELFGGMRPAGACGSADQSGVRGFVQGGWEGVATCCPRAGVAIRFCQPRREGPAITRRRAGREDFATCGRQRRGEGPATCFRQARAGHGSPGAGFGSGPRALQRPRPGLHRPGGTAGSHPLPGRAAKTEGGRREAGPTGVDVADQPSGAGRSPAPGRFVPEVLGPQPGFVAPAQAPRPPGCGGCAAATRDAAACSPPSFWSRGGSAPGSCLSAS